VKRDLNLIPRAESQNSANKYVLPIVLIVVLYAATAYLAITIPQQRLQAKENEHSVLAQKVAGLEYIESEYQLLRLRLGEVEAKKQTILRTKHSDKDAINLLSLVEIACPEEILLTDIIVTTDGITIMGTSQNDALVAEFMVNLRAIELFVNSNIARVDPSGIDFAKVQEALAEGTEVPVMRQFQLALAYSAHDIIEDAQATAGEG